MVSVMGAVAIYRGQQALFRRHALIKPMADVLAEMEAGESDIEQPYADQGDHKTLPPTAHYQVQKRNPIWRLW